MQSESGFWQDNWRENVVERGLAASDGLAFVWEDAGEVLGFVCAHDLGFRGYVSELIVRLSARGRGVGRKLVERVHRDLTARGCAILISDVRHDAEGFYISLGWSAPYATLLRKRLGHESSEQNKDPTHGRELQDICEIHPRH